MYSGINENDYIESNVFVSRVSSKFLFLLHFIEIPVVNTNSVAPDQMHSSVASDLGLHCLPITLLGSPD